MVPKKVIIFLIGAIAISAMVAAIFLVKKAQIDEEQRNGAELLVSLGRLSTEYFENETLAKWNYEINMTEETKAHKSKITADYEAEKENILNKMKKLNWKNFRDQKLKNDFENRLEHCDPDAALKASFNEALNKMGFIYFNTQICDYMNKTKCDLKLEPEIEEIFEKIQDPEELKHTWLEWHQKVGQGSNDAFKQYVSFRKELYPTRFNESDQWINAYRERNFEEQLRDLWLKIEPLYLQIHAFVRKQLYDKYGPGIVNRRGPIPAHLLGNMWGESWLNLVSYIRPYPNKPVRNITSVMLKKNFTALKMFQMADEFFQSINLTAVPSMFWEKSVLTKPNDGRQMNCDVIAWEMGDGDYRVKLCAVVNDKHFEMAHHVMGHIQYYIQYSQQPSENHCGSNPGFHEGVSDLIPLSATSSKHLQKVGLLEDECDYESCINELFRKGAEKLAIIPFSYLLDLYRFALFKGPITPKNYNCYFWKLKEKYQGVEPPVRRTEEDCDAVANVWVSTNSAYTQAFVSQVIQFQFHKELCKIAGEYEEGNDNMKLSDCDIFQSAKAGNALGDMLKLGSSVNGAEALKQLTGENRMNASGLLEYFEPLRIWLEKENKRTGELIGWEKSKIEFCTGEQESELQPLLASDTMSTMF